MQTRGSTNKSPIKLSMQQKIKVTVICLRMGKTYTTKTPPGDFKVTTLEIQLLSQQALTSKGIPVPYTNLHWTLTPIPNWTCFVVTICPFDARLPVRDYPIAWIPVHDFNHQLEKELATNFFSSSQQWRSRRFLVIKPYSAQIEQLLHKNDELGQNCVSGHNLFKQILLNTCAACEHFDGP